jgi:hypothetical protein
MMRSALTCLDIVLAGVDIVLTGADNVSTAMDNVLTGVDIVRFTFYASSGAYIRMSLHP